MSKLKFKSAMLTVLLIIMLLAAAGLAVLFYYPTNVTSNLDKFEYELPYEKGNVYKVVQGYGGLFSHRYAAAIDFEMPVGTPVCAARDGVVYSYRDQNDEGGPFARHKRKANYIIIKHSDGSYGCYWHLKKNGVITKTGRVSKGQRIAISGNTGQVLKPHLHFSVKRKLNYEMDSFVRTKFKTTEGTVLLKRGKSYVRPAD